MHTKQDAPDGWEWKHVKLPRHEPVYPSRWLQCRYVARDANDTILAVLVKCGEPGIRRLPCEDGQA